jgi:hyaluronan synthase
VLFLGDPFLFFYTYFITVFELSRVVAAMAFMRTTGEIEPMSGYDFYEPTITFVIPCKNEEAAIERTISNCFAADYPADKVEVIVVNDGSTDGTIGVLRRLEHTYPTLVVVDWKENKGKRHGMAEGFKRATGEIAIQLDSDSFIEPSSIRHLVRPFATPSIGAVCAHADPLNADDNLLTKMQSAYYFMSFRILKAAESTFLTVFCCSGCSSAYRKSVVLPIIGTWLGERFLGKPITWGDDRALTNWVLRLGYDTIYSDKAQARTIVPTSLKQFLKQQVRWKKGWFVNSLLIAGFILRDRPFVAVTYFLPLILVTLMTPFMAVKAILYGPLVAHTLPVTYFFGVLLMATIVMLYYRWISRDNKYWPFVLLWAAFNSLVLSTILFYAVLRLNDRGWGTR